MDFFRGLGADLTADRCEKLQSPGYVNLAISLLILFGILISYLPQHYRIIARGTSEGISPYFVLLGTTSATATFANILVLPTSRADVACCKEVSTFECAAGLLGIAQVGTQWLSFSVILALFLIFFPRLPDLPNSTTKYQYTWRTAVGVALICLVHGLATIIISTALFLARPHLLGGWANLMGICATVLAAIQYFPQIWMTYSLGHVGSLSIPMMLIQTPGAFLWAGSLAARLGMEGWSTWGIFLVTGCLQGCLLVMGIYFELRARRVAQSTEDNSNTTFIAGYARSPRVDAETDDEGGAIVEDVLTARTPLLKNSTRRNGSVR
ncbi:hypothetical protein OIDMADRAFT_42287 [Oidiodendron maius Zn]|uniref:PQ loop repeat protein n=1 Tax=Oidiodendron maius (strain Zn) TaxID=913774 RepID=A0A0C3HAV3_OIDMZ|nr:hypothetical protein OIDMADRAFT_42287 [Oidiodendron maius Zn]